jgi:Zn finger protein HypA/HybF involved in hydrogenase expression
MFFVAGLSPKLYQIGSVTGECPACGGEKLFLVKKSQALSIFFIPVVKFGGEYLATCGTCASVMELHKEAGKRAEKDLHTTLSAHEMRVIKNNAGHRCSQCGRRVYEDESYCPGCGHKL